MYKHSKGEKQGSIRIFHYFIISGLDRLIPVDREGKGGMFGLLDSSKVGNQKDCDTPLVV